MIQSMWRAMAMTRRLDAWGRIATKYGSRWLSCCNQRRATEFTGTMLDHITLAGLPNVASSVGIPSAADLIVYQIETSMRRSLTAVLDPVGGGQKA